MFTRGRTLKYAKRDKPETYKPPLVDDLLTIAHFVLSKVTAYAPYSSNTNTIEGTSEEQAIHRLLWVNAMRARNDKDGIRQLIYNWNIDVSPTEADERYENRRVTISSKECTLNNLSRYLHDNCEPEEFHVRLNEESQLEEIQCTITDLNNYVYDKIEPLDFKEKRQDGSVYSSKERNESIALRLAKWGIGNCSDLSQAAMAMLMHYPSRGFNEPDLPSIKNSVPIEILTLDDGDHEFIVINRQAGSHLSEPNTWGSDVIILDPWLRECYLLDEALSHSRQTNSVKIIFQTDAYAVENTGTISDGTSSRWRKTHDQYDIFKLQVRATHPEEQIPWVTPELPALKRDSLHRR